MPLLHDGLSARLGRASVFIDEDDISAGEDFRDAIAREIEAATVVIVLIGNNWSAPMLHPRTDSSIDYVEFELQLALSLRKKIIPILVGDEKMPDAAVLPASIRNIAFLQALDFRGDDFHRLRVHFDRLLSEIEKNPDGSRDAPATSIPH